MTADGIDIERIVKEVLEELGRAREGREKPNPVVAPQTPKPSFIPPLHQSAPEKIDDMVEASRQAFIAFRKLGIETRSKIISAIRAICESHAEELGKFAVEETGLGKMPDKAQKALLAVRKTPGIEDLISRSFSGDHGLTLEELAPYGVIGSITPSTNPVSTIINNSISMLSAGNSVIFCPHPTAKRVSYRTATLIQEAVLQAGGPPNLVQAIKEPSQEIARALMHHAGIDLLVVTGGGVVVDLAMKSGKKAICAGPGNPPVVVDETAIIEKAGRDIVEGASFDNNVLCIAEKEVFVVESVAERLKRVMRECGAYEISGSAVERLTHMVIAEDKEGKGERHPIVNRAFVGKNASFILEKCGITPPKDVRLIIFEAQWDHPIVMAEQLMPVLPVVRVRDVGEAIRYAIIAEHRFKHTFIMHSTNIVALSKMAQLCDANIFVKNGPSLAGLGFNGEGYTTLTIAGTTGEGLTTARTFARPRRCTLVDYFRIV